MISSIHRLGVLLLMLGGCSLAMRGLDPGWVKDPRKEPKCSQSYRPVYIDSAMAIGLASGAADLTRESLMGGRDIYQARARLVVWGTANVLSLLYAASASIGSAKYKNCRSARGAWYANQAIRESTANSEPARPGSAHPGKQVASNRTAVADLPAGSNDGAPDTPSPSKSNAHEIGPAEAPTPTGYFCASSPSQADSSICMRERAACEFGRQALALPECLPSKVAWCFDLDGNSQCFGTLLACAAQLATATSAAGPCTERP